MPDLGHNKEVIFTKSIGIGGSPSDCALLELLSTTKGICLSRMTPAQRDAIISPLDSLIVYDITNHKIDFYNGTTWKALVATEPATFIPGGIVFATDSHEINDDSNLFWDNVNKHVGIGTNVPARMLHIQGRNAVLRIDRDTNSPAFLIHIFPSGDFSTPNKGFLVGVDASGADDGTFFISDTHQAVSGGGDPRFTIENDGTITIPGALNIPSANNPAGDFKLQPDAQGNVVLFGDTDVADDANGKILYVYRKASEGNNYMRFYISASEKGYIHTSCPMTLQAQVDFTINSVTENIIFKVGDNAGSKKFYFKDSDGNNIATIDSQGNTYFAGSVGIGTQTPGLRVEIRDTDDNLALFMDERPQALGVGGGIAFGGKYTDAGAEAMSGRVGTKKTNGTSGDIGFDMVIATQDSAGTMTQRAIFLSNGKVGIGDITPIDKLHVDGNLRLNGNLSNVANINMTGDLTSDGTLMSVAIETSGNIGAGKSSPNFRIDAYVNRTTGIVRSARFQTDGNHVDARGLYVIAGEDTESGTNYWFEAYDGNGGTNTGGLRSIGGVFDVYNASDERLKQNIISTKVNAKDIINNLKVRDFEWKANPGHTITGFIAQEVMTIYPEAIGDPNPGTGMYGMSKTALIPILVKYTQELEARITKLEVNK